MSHVCSYWSFALLTAVPIAMRQCRQADAVRMTVLTFTLIAHHQAVSMTGLSTHFAAVAHHRNLPFGLMSFLLFLCRSSARTARCGFRCHVWINMKQSILKVLLAIDNLAENNNTVEMDPYACTMVSAKNLLWCTRRRSCHETCRLFSAIHYNFA